MFKRLTSSHLAILLAGATIVGCTADQALIVSPRLGGGAPPLGVVSDPAGAPVHPVQRQVALLQDRSWSFDVGPAGTTVKDGPTGLTIDVPAGAVASTTHITVIALKGAPLAYRFEPHGLQFVVPVRLTQSLRGLKVVSPLGVPHLFGGYFAADSLASDAATGEARVCEILPLRIDIKAQAALLDIRHFSGYTVASAERDSSLVER
jgi:hypothetical protein